MDTLSIYACTPMCAMEAKREVRCVYVGTVTDVQQGEDEEWKSDLKDAVRRENAHPHDELVRFLVERMLPRLDF